MQCLIYSFPARVFDRFQCLLQFLAVIVTFARRQHTMQSHVNIYLKVSCIHNANLPVYTKILFQTVSL